MVSMAIFKIYSFSVNLMLTLPTHMGGGLSAQATSAFHTLLQYCWSVF